MPTKKADLVTRMITWRRAKGLTQAQAAERFAKGGGEFSLRTLESWERRRNKPRLEAAEVILATINKDGF